MSKVKNNVHIEFDQNTILKCITRKEELFFNSPRVELKFNYKDTKCIINCLENGIEDVEADHYSIECDTSILIDEISNLLDNGLKQFINTICVQYLSKQKTARKIVKNNKLEPYVINGNTSNMIMAKSIEDAERKSNERWPDLKIDRIETLGSSDTVHELKIHPQEFALVCTGLKKAEFRSTDDRDFRINDLIKLNEWEPECKYYTGRSATVIITHIQTGFGIPEGYAMISNSMLTHNLNNKYSESKKDVVTNGNMAF